MSTGSTTRGKTILCLLLCLLCQSRENKCVYSSYDSLSFLAASLLVPCIPWFQQAVRYRETVSTSFLSVTPSTWPFKPEEAPPTHPVERLLPPCICAQLLGGLPSKLFVHDSHPRHNIQLLSSGLPLPLRFPSDSWLDWLPASLFCPVEEDRPQYPAQLSSQNRHLDHVNLPHRERVGSSDPYSEPLRTCPHGILKPTEGGRVPAGADNWEKPPHFRGQTSSFMGLSKNSISLQPTHLLPLHGVRPFPHTYYQMSPDHSRCSLDGVLGVSTSCPRWT